SVLDLKKIKQVWFAITKASGGSGTFAADQLEVPESGDLEQGRPGRLISDLKIINNPFSPNDDKIKDEIIFDYMLGAASKVNLRIYNLQGNEVRTIAVQDQNAGE